MLIRPEKPSDYETISQIHLAAFATCPYSQLTEHLIVEGLRADHALSVSLVAEIDGKVVGHIAFSMAIIDGKECGWYLLGPVGVFPALQRQGIGQALVNEGLKRIKELGAKGCVLVGDPAYYCRFGFQNNCPLRMEGVPPEFVQALPMGGEIPKGELGHHPAFMVKNEKGSCNHEKAK
jgi:putative acetyltransferase